MKMFTALWAPATFAVLSFFAIEAMPGCETAGV